MTNNIQLENEKIALNLMNASLILSNKELITNTDYLFSQQLFESVINYDRNFNNSQIFMNNTEFLKLWESKNIGGILATPEAKEHVIPYRNNNMYSYLSKINEMVNTKDNGMIRFFESDNLHLNNIKDTIKVLLAQYAKQNDFTRYNSTVLSVKSLKNEVNVFGFNLFDSLKMAELKQQNIHLLMFDKNNQNIIIFIGIKDSKQVKLLSYNIKTDILQEYIMDYYTGEYIAMVCEPSIDKIMLDLKRVINSELHILYIDNTKFENKKEFNNLFNDQVYSKLLENHNQKNNQVSKSPNRNGYLVK